MAVHGEDGEILIPGHRLRTLLALLLAEPNRVISAAQLAAGLWDRPPQNADRTILTYLSRLRRTLDGAHAGATIVTRSAGYALQINPNAIDAARFAQLAEDGRAALDAGEYETASNRLSEALALWRGDAYSEFLDILPLRVEADRLKELRGTAREDRIAADLAVLPPEVGDAACWR
jgi:DNA-binding SARP family transcriptional activator